MSEGMIWRKCPHCAKERFCTEQAMHEHQEDCDKRPSKTRNMKLCPKCGSVVERVTSAHYTTWLCVNEACDYELVLTEGGKLT